MTFSVDLVAPNYVNTHSLTINGKDDDISLEDLLEIAKKNDIKNPSALIEQVRVALAMFADLAIESAIDKDLVNKIKDRFILL